LLRFWDPGTTLAAEAEEKLGTAEQVRNTIMKWMYKTYQRLPPSSAVIVLAPQRSIGTGLIG